MCVTLSLPERQVLVTCVCCIKSTRDTGHLCVTLSLSEGQVMYVMLNEVMTDRDTNCCIFKFIYPGYMYICACSTFKYMYCSVLKRPFTNLDLVI